MRCWTFTIVGLLRAYESLTIKMQQESRYSVPHSTLATRLEGIEPRRDSTPNSQELTEVDGVTII